MMLILSKKTHPMKRRDDTDAQREVFSFHGHEFIDSIVSNLFSRYIYGVYTLNCFCIL